jgi:neutral ceramidase
MSATMLAGAAEVDITPPVGTALAGYFTPRISEGVIWPLKAKALIAGEGAEAVGIVACDLISMPPEIVAAAREKFTASTGIPGSRLLICATHTHTGPETRPGRLIPTNDDYLALLPGLIADAAIAAAGNRRACVLSVGRDQEEGLAFNRRFRLRDGSEQFGPGEETAGVAGPTDPEMGVLKFAEEGRDPFALIVNYSLHIDVTSGNLISADYPAMITETVRATYGPDTIVLFVQGACGNINHVPYLQERAWPIPRSGVQKSTQIGRALGGKALCIAEKAYPSLDQTVDIEQGIMDVPAYPRNDDVLEQRLAIARAQDPPNFFNQTLLKWIDSYDDTVRRPVDIQTIRLGDAVFCSAPGELFVEWGLQMKKWSPHPFTFIAELANDTVGYIPTYEAFRRGGYEATPVVSVKLTPALGQMVTDANFRGCQKLWDRKAKA